MPHVRRVLETALYCDDLTRTAAFYQRLLQREPLLRSDRLVAFDAGEGTVLLLFQRGASRAGSRTPGGIVPPHEGSGALHCAFAIDRTDVATWERQLADWGVPLESRVTWEQGGVSLYFRDPDGHSVELATPGTWATY